MSRYQFSLCESCCHSYYEYGEYLCKFEGGDEDISQEYIDGETVTECECYEEDAL